MFSKSLLILLAALSLANVALGSPHLVNRRHHHAVAARGQSAPRNVSGAIQKRALRKRCRTREPPSSTVVASSSAAANVAPPPPPPTTSAVEATTSTSSTQQQEPTRAPEQQQPPPPPPSTTSEPPPPSTTSEQSAPTQDSGNNGNNDNGNNNNNNNGGGGGGGIISGLASYAVGTLTGQGTFYNTGLVACGTTHSDSEHIVAVSTGFFDGWPGANGNPNLNPICNKRIRATFEGKSVDLTIVDRCEGCAMYDVDMTPSAFSIIADQARGRISGVTWTFI